MTRAGALDRMASFEVAVLTPDGGGGETMTYLPEFERWAGLRFMPLSAQAESVVAGALGSVSRAILTVRSDPETEQITADSKVSVEGREWNVLEVQPVVEHGMIRMIVATGVAL